VLTFKVHQNQTSSKHAASFPHPGKEKLSHYTILRQERKTKTKKKNRWLLQRASVTYFQTFAPFQRTTNSPWSNPFKSSSLPTRPNRDFSKQWKRSFHLNGTSKRLIFFQVLTKHFHIKLLMPPAIVMSTFFFVIARREFTWKVSAAQKYNNLPKVNAHRESLLNAHTEVCLLGQFHFPSKNRV